MAAILLAILQTYKTEHSFNQEIFMKGTADLENLNGDFKGFVVGYEGSWQGKSFNKVEASGINRFKNGEAIIRNYPFKLVAAKGLRDNNLDVIKLDYNQPENPWWLRRIVDEVVKTSDNTYLGKFHIRLSQKFVVSLGYFTLQK